ncbi:hypothetical protein [Nitrosarchaeum sp.]|uniref:hypothetical protein n=1 Tax=Nitrosarchaeum sp. TaxID=2026886 RepID=UPI002601667D|nr:hypothetical protein [Nitrosarchaeum sp.]
MKYVNPLRLKVLMMMFFVTGIVGIVVGLKVAPPNTSLLITFMGVINISLGGFFGWVFLNQTPQSDNKRKKKRDNN